MYYLLQIITPEIECIWLPQQHCKIAILTLHSLQVVVPNLLEDFIECTGINRSVARTYILKRMYNFLFQFFNDDGHLCI